MSEWIAPIDCKDIATAKKLNEQGIGKNGDSILVKPNLVILTIDSATIKIPQSTFNMFVKWYITPQKLETPNL